MSKVKFFYSTVNDDGTTSELTPEGWAQVVEVQMPEGTAFDEIPLEEAEETVLADLEEKGIEIGEVTQVTVVGTDADGNEAYYDYNLVEDDKGNLSLEPKSEDDDYAALLGGDDPDEDDHPDKDDEDDDDDHGWWC
ncbi:hypothetical protein ROE7235_00946 [Roseibaca ekhonensis]|uniref:Uncharacterized protein n=1 Tax=Roseinatronobacter ekhonensis TaxID=254356 RepID=A0A3B0M724_9RHOB|nr:hypothetical protein [Roseibaca ekhonensis]SUZ31210.1 hypothetical protein ROE7235_00946 [Roseibaca ekhonensis]